MVLRLYTDATNYIAGEVNRLRIEYLPVPVRVNCQLSFVASRAAFVGQLQMAADTSIVKIEVLRNDTVIYTNNQAFIINSLVEEISDEDDNDPAINLILQENNNED